MSKLLCLVRRTLSCASEIMVRVFSPEKVGFKQAELLDGRLCELRRESVLLNHHRTMLSSFWSPIIMPHACLPSWRIIPSMTSPLFKYVLYLGIVRDFLSELGGHFDRLFKSHFKLVGDHFCDGIGTVEGNAVYARQVAHGRPLRQACRTSQCLRPYRLRTCRGRIL